MKKAVIIMGSSSSTGNTAKISKQISDNQGVKFIDLNQYDISYFDYEHQNEGDDFIPLMEQLVKENEIFIFSTPVYWYNMSAVMKTFLDRFSDLLHIRKDLGYQLKTKKMMVISNSSDSELDYDFSMNFRKSAEYLGMEFLGHQHFQNTIENPTLQLQLTEN